MIGIFDSGFGGLSTFKQVVNILPQYNYIYLGDNARTPYGDKSSEVLLHYTEQVLQWFHQKKVPLVIFACNTASAVTLRKLQQTWIDGKKYPLRVLGVIRPLVEEAVKESHNKHIGIIGTTATIQSGAIDREMRHLVPSIKITSKATPLFVPFIEEGRHHTPEMTVVIQEDLESLKKAKIDTLVLGCTHYEHIRPQIQKAMGKNVHIINQAEIVARKLEDYLKRHPEIEKKCTKGGKREIYTTETAEKFWAVGKKMATLHRKDIHHTTLE